MLSKIKKKIWKQNSETDAGPEDEYEMQKANFHKWLSEEYSCGKDILKFFKIFWFGLDKTYTY